MTEISPRRVEMATWADWAGDLVRASVRPDGRRTLRWALDVIESFYGDEWFARQAARGSIPVMSLNDWPLSTAKAVVRLLERAAQLSLAPEQVRTALADGTNGIRASTDAALFGHLDLVLEVIGLAARDGWSVEAEVGSGRGRWPDLRLTRGTLSYTVEITRQGHDRSHRRADEQAHAITWRRLELEVSQHVDCCTQVQRLLEDSELDGLLQAMTSVALATEESGNVTTQELAFANVTVYPAGQRPRETTIAEGPLLTGDLWPRFATRLRAKAKQTVDAGPAWIRIDELGGLLALTPASRMPIEQHLALLSDRIRHELSSFRHVQGVVISHGAEADSDSRRPERTAQDFVTDAEVIERVLPGGRRRRTFIVPVHSFSGLTLPDHLVLQPGRWYETEGRWLDWALNRLGHPAASTIVSGRSLPVMQPERGKG